MARKKLLLGLLLAAAAIGSAGLLYRIPARDMPYYAREAVLRTDLRTMRDCIAQFHGDKNRHPDSLQELVKAGYLHKIPIDPVTRRADTWRPRMVRAGALLETRVVDVHSGSEKVGSDGRPYSQW